MKTKDRNLLICGIAIVIVIAILAPFLASKNPDGLESTAEKLNPEALESEPVFNSIMPDYEIPALGGGPISGVIAILIGGIIVLVIGYGLGHILKKGKNN
jgi:cobalt/nickel transport protein